MSGSRLFDELARRSAICASDFRRNKGFTAAAIATLALGIGANTAVFSVVDALLLRTLPVNELRDELVVFDWLRTPDAMVAGYSGYGRPGPAGLGIRTSFSALTVERFREHAATLSDVFAFSPPGTLNIGADRQADTASGLFVTGNYFAGLGVRALLGRTLSASDDRPQAEPVAVISHRYWRRRFAGDPNVDREDDRRQSVTCRDRGRHAGRIRWPADERVERHHATLAMRRPAGFGRPRAAGVVLVAADDGRD